MRTYRQTMWIFAVIGIFCAITGIALNVARDGDLDGVLLLIGAAIFFYGANVARRYSD